jgi:hypothetical protein
LGGKNRRRLCYASRSLSYLDSTGLWTKKPRRALWIHSGARAEALPLESLITGSAVRGRNRGRGWHRGAKNPAERPGVRRGKDRGDTLLLESAVLYRSSAGYQRRNCGQFRSNCGLTAARETIKSGPAIERGQRYSRGSMRGRVLSAGSIRQPCARE